MKPKTEIFFDAITLLREDIVEEAQDYRFRKKPAVWKKFGSLAACLVLIASISLLMLPRGCGSSGGNADMNNSSAPMAPADSSGAPAGEPETGAPVSGDPAPEPSEAPAGGPEYGHEEQVQFTAVVIEINESSVLVEPLEGEQLRDSYGQIVVVARELELPELAVGDEIRITFDGWIAESEPAVITGAEAVELLEK